MKIGIDLDCVLNNLNEEWLSIYNKKYSDSLTIEDIHSWDIAKYVKKECGKKIFDILREDNFLENLKPIPFSTEATKRLMKDHEIYIVTATHYTGVKEKVEWVKRYFPHIDINNIVICQDKSLINVDLLIDDGGHNIESFHGEAIVLDYAWNRYLENKYPRAYSWLDVEDILANIQIEKGK